MGRFLLRRLLLVVPSLLGISLLTFVLLHLTPGSMLGSVDPDGALTLEKAHRRAQLELGMIDPATGEAKSVTTRYGEWLSRAVQVRFGSPGEDEGAFRARLARALPPTLLVNGFALWFAILLGIRLGARLGTSAGSRFDRACTVPLAIVAALPEMLLATLLLLAFGGGLGLALLPSGGLVTPGGEAWPTWRRALDLGAHLVLPVLVVALPATVIVARFVRDAVARARHGSAAGAAFALGATDAELHGMALRSGLAPLATLLPPLLASGVAGSLVVEQTFGIDGMGMLAWRAFQERDQAMVMALTTLVGAFTLVALVVSDLLHAALDPRVRLS